MYAGGALVAALILSACGGDEGGEGTESESAATTTTGDATGSTGSTAPSTSETTGTGDGDGDATSSGDGDGETGMSSLDCTHVWGSGFENGFPGEWDSYDNGSWSEDGTMPPGRVSAWTIIDAGSGEPVFAGDHAYKGWIEGPANESHRAYPGTSAVTETPFVNTFYVYLDVDYDALGGEWIHFGTWGNYMDGMGLYALHTMSVRERELEFAHTDPFLGEYIGPDPQPEFPTGQWVRFTVYGHYEGTTGFVKVWQDGEPMLQATVSQLADNPGTYLSYAHWGMYAGATASTGTQYNDEINVWRLDAPLADLEAEPDCYLGG